jgi:hypothetical protein
MAQTIARVPVTPGEPHHVGFDKALDRALNEMQNNFDEGRHDVQVTYELEVDVQSPGNIGFYKVTLTG